MLLFQSRGYRYIPRVDTLFGWSHQCQLQEAQNRWPRKQVKLNYKGEQWWSNELRVLSRKGEKEVLHLHLYSPSASLYNPYPVPNSSHACLCVCVWVSRECASLWKALETFLVDKKCLRPFSGANSSVETQTLFSYECILDDRNSYLWIVEILFLYECMLDGPNSCRDWA